jgi:hypothetical protein
MKLSRAQRELIGEELFSLSLASGNPADPELVEKIIVFLSKPRVGILPKFEAMAQARDCCAILVEHGYDYQWAVDLLDWDLRRIVGWSCQELARQLRFDDRISESDRNEGYAFLGRFTDEEWLLLMQAAESGSSPSLVPRIGDVS